jgi:predicted  nucleic acid-binding Zn-ribbon protein
MSRRRIEAGFNNQSSFSLRTLSTAGAASPAAATNLFTRNTPPPAIPQQASLSFKFDSLGTRPVAVASQGSPPLRAAVGNALPNNFFSKPVNAGVSSNTAESMRLTALVDDLTQRLRKTNEAKATLEGQVTRLNGALVQERSAAQQRLSALKTEVATVQESEMRLRTELAQRPAVREVDTQKFATRVRSALEQEETNAKVADAEARLGAVVKRHESLAAEVKLLESRKADALAATASALTVEEVEELVARAATAESAMRDAEDRKATLDDDIARYTAMRDAHQREMLDAETALFRANAATAAAVVDESAAKQQLVDVKLKHENVVEQVSQLSKEMEGMSAASKAPTTFSVTGACAPAHNDAVFSSPMAQVAAAGCCGHGLGYHFNYDAPLNITAIAPDPHGDQETNKMITALVSDLQSYFQTSAAAHEMIGRPMDSQMAIGAVEVAA